MIMYIMFPGDYLQYGELSQAWIIESFFDNVYILFPGDYLQYGELSQAWLIELFYDNVYDIPKGLSAIW